MNCPSRPVVRSAGDNGLGGVENESQQLPHDQQENTDHAWTQHFRPLVQDSFQCYLCLERFNMWQDTVRLSLVGVCVCDNCWEELAADRGNPATNFDLCVICGTLNEANANVTQVWTCPALQHHTCFQCYASLQSRALSSGWIADPGINGDDSFRCPACHALDGGHDFTQSVRDDTPAPLDYECVATEIGDHIKSSEDILDELGLNQTSTDQTMKFYCREGNAEPQEFLKRVDIDAAYLHCVPEVLLEQAEPYVPGKVGTLPRGLSMEKLKGGVVISGKPFWVIITSESADKLRAVLDAAPYGHKVESTHQYAEYVKAPDTQNEPAWPQGLSAASAHIPSEDLVEGLRKAGVSHVFAVFSVGAKADLLVWIQKYGRYIIPHTEDHWLGGPNLISIGFNEYVPGVPLHTIAPGAEATLWRRRLPTGVHLKISPHHGECGGFQAGGLSVYSANDISVHHKTTIYCAQWRHQFLNGVGQQTGGGMKTWPRTVKALKGSFGCVCNTLRHFEGLPTAKLNGVRVEHTIYVSKSYNWFYFLWDVLKGIINAPMTLDLLFDASTSDGQAVVEGLCVRPSDAINVLRRAIEMTRPLISGR